jgi:hypothetical protein
VTELEDLQPATPPVTERDSSVVSGDVSLIDDFEAPDALDRWWLYTGEGTIVFDCVIDQGFESDHALRLVYDIGPGADSACNMNWEAGEPWASAEGIRFHWRADRPGRRPWLASTIPQATSGTRFTFFEVELRMVREDWSEVTLFWDDFTKPEWQSESGVSVFDPAQAYHLGFDVGYWESAQSGSIWIDNIELLMRQQ